MAQMGIFKDAIFVIPTILLSAGKVQRIARAGNAHHSLAQRSDSIG